MGIKYESVVPWGRSYPEYVAMFNLTPSDLNKSILSCGDGPASFNSSMNQKGKNVVSIDPVYSLSRTEIEKRIDETCKIVMAQTKNNQDKFEWSGIGSVEELFKIRIESMKEFLSDYEVGKHANRYITAELPFLPFESNEFDLSLSSHFLFLYTENLSLEFHLKSIDEMLRVSKEVRIFPLLDMNAITSPYVNQVIDGFSRKGYDVETVRVNYEFQKGGNLMLKIIK
nr:SAM-dependent methyltransferase [uncultured Methanobacterium sp.]